MSSVIDPDEAVFPGLLDDAVDLAVGRREVLVPGAGPTCRVDGGGDGFDADLLIHTSQSSLVVKRSRRMQNLTQLHI